MPAATPMMIRGSGRTPMLQDPLACQIRHPTPRAETCDAAQSGGGDECRFRRRQRLLPRTSLKRMLTRSGLQFRRWGAWKGMLRFLNSSKQQPFGSFGGCSESTTGERNGPACPPVGCGRDGEPARNFGAGLNTERSFPSRSAARTKGHSRSLHWAPFSRRRLR